jgi:drug/metabolite transporter (DMT)-like permease
VNSSAREAGREKAGAPRAPRLPRISFVTVAGAILVIYTPPEGSPEHFYLGIGLALLATFGWGVEGVLAIHSMEVIDAAVAGTIRMATSVVIYFARVILLTGGYAMIWEAPQAPSLRILALVEDRRRRHTGDP